jgi:hypothetical protein
MKYDITLARACAFFDDGHGIRKKRRARVNMISVLAHDIQRA